MSQPLPTCTTIAGALTDSQGGIATLIQGLLDGQSLSSMTTPAQEPSNSQPFISAEQPWLLWVEPVPKANSEKCPALFTHNQTQTLKEKINNHWQFSECYWFVPGRTLQAVATKSAIRIKACYPMDSKQTKSSRTPYLWQLGEQQKRFSHLNWLNQAVEGAELLANGQLRLVAYSSERDATLEYIVAEVASR